MKSWLKIGAVITGLTWFLSGCAPMPERTRETPSLNIVQVPSPSEIKPTRLVTPTDTRVVAAMNEALPVIQKTLGIHRCIKDWQSLRLLNAYAVPGVDMTHEADNRYSFPNDDRLKYHDHNLCVNITTIDSWTMPAPNTLIFRAVYFAEDSSESINFGYLFKKTDEKTWKLATFCSSSYLYGCNSDIISILRN